MILLQGPTGVYPVFRGVGPAVPFRKALQREETRGDTQVAPYRKEKQQEAAMVVQEDRVVLRIPANKVTEPIISRIVKDFDITVNILKAQIVENDEGLMVLGLQGTGTALKAARKYLAGLGVRVQELKRDVKKSDTRCVDCGACVGQCPTGALYVTQEFEVKLDAAKCIACGHCAVACTFDAVEVRFGG